MLFAINIFDVISILLVMLKRFFLITLFTISTTIVYSQKIVKFSNDSIKFYKELNDYFYEFSANKKDAIKC